jgi:SAM-dependent MidA family methyltransferase
LLDAMPVHQVVMRRDGLREVYVDLAPGRLAPPGRLVLREDRPSTPALAEYFDRLGLALEPGWRAEVSLQAVEWTRRAARALRRGFLVFIDYGHEAGELYSATHAGGTLTSFSAHRSSGPEADGTPPWLERPGDRDITAHVDFTSIRQAALDEGLVELGWLDQTYFLLGLLGAREALAPQSSLAQLKERLALKTLLMPGGLGSTMKVLILGRDVGVPELTGCSYRQRVT